MDDRYLFLINDLIEHKKLILDCSKVMSNYLYLNGEQELSKKIIERAIIHDNSKLDDNELKNFLELKIKEKAFKNAKSLLNDYEKEKISVHWKKNRHHLEYFNNIEDMQEIDIIEMVCDWFSRSLQYGTDIIEFAETRQKNRFKFSEDMYKKIIKYCNILKDSYDK